MDLHYFNSNNTKHTAECYVDSTFRDRLRYPNANEYTVEFVEPFRNVVGMEIVDARIPQSEYAIHERNNRLVLVSAANVANTVVIPPGDYTVSEFADAFNAAGVEFAQPIQLHVLSVRSKMVLRSVLPFHVDLRASTAISVFGFDADVGIHSSLLSIQNTDQFENIVFQDTTSSTVSFIESDPLKVYEHTFRIEATEIPEVYFVQEIEIPEMKLILPENVVPLIQFKVEILRDGDVLGEVETVREPLFRFEKDVDVFPGDECVVRLSFTRVERFDISKIQIPVHNDSQTPTMVRNHGTSLVSETSQYNSIPLSDEHPDFHGIRMRIQAEKRVYSVIPSGKYHLNPDPYAVLRCKEMEPHFPNGIVRHHHDVHRKSSFMFGTAIRLCDPNASVSDEFKSSSSFSKRLVELTPIHKLTRMSFLLENVDGSKYDCNGYNHSFTVRLYCMNVQSNVHQQGFQPQTVYPEVEAVNERAELYLLG
jgi:hypothetical protein